MVGLCGVIGEGRESLDPLVKRLPTSDGEQFVAYHDDNIAVYIATHSQFHEEQPATADGGALIWMYGNPYGFDKDEGYETRTDYSITDAEYCADLYDKHGMGFVENLNGEFAGLVFDRQEREVHLFTDRLGTRPLFYGQLESGFLFSSRLQSIGLHPEVDPAFDRDYLAEFFAVQKAFGTATALAGIRKVPPSSVLSVGLDGTLYNDRTYWQPQYRPVDRSSTELAEEVVATFRQVFEERVRDDLTYGVLLSGGSDSRLILGAMTERDRTPTAFHMTNWMSREARIAERVASTAGVDFQILRRGTDYHDQLLELVPQFSNFVGAFDESIATGFTDELDSVDVVLTGYLGDTMFGEYPLYVPKAESLIHPGYEHRLKSISEYIERYLGRYSTPAEVPDFLDSPEITDIMGQNMNSDRGTIWHHGVEYRSLKELQLCEYYPLTNQFASANSDSVRQITGHWSPFFDNRLIDLHLTVPTRDRIRSDPINHAINRLSPSLASISHPSTGIPLNRSIRNDWKYNLRRAGVKIKRRCTADRPPTPFVSHSPWIDESELIRNHDFIETAIDRNSDLLEALPFLDAEGVEKCYQDHLEGANNWRALYALATLLESPIAKRIGS